MSIEKLNDAALNLVSGASDQEVRELKQALLAHRYFREIWDATYDDDYESIDRDRRFVDRMIEDYFDDPVQYGIMKEGTTPNEYIDWEDRSFSHQEMLRIIRNFKR